jgi:hypothetical protein
MAEQPTKYKSHTVPVPKRSVCIKCGKKRFTDKMEYVKINEGIGGNRKPFAEYRCHQQFGRCPDHTWHKDVRRRF